MQLRRRILSQGRAASTGRDEAIAAYDGRADQELIMRQLELVMPFDHVMGQVYQAMFEERPYLRSMFPESMDFQRDKLVKAFMYLVENLHRPDVIAPAFERLGSEHRKLGVRAAHYETFKRALRQGLRRCGGPSLAAEAEAAWMRATDFAVEAMVRGAEAAIAEPPYWNADVIAHERRLPDLAVIQVGTYEPYPYRAGQYATIQSRLVPNAWRPYWIACAPREDSNGLEFHVRMTGPGGLSEALVLGTKAGDTLRIGPPSGEMTLLYDEPKRDLLMVALDTGLAPLRAMLEELSLQWPERRRADLLVAVRSRPDLYDLEALGDLEVRCPGLRVTPVVADEPDLSGGPDPLADALLRMGDWSDHIAYIGGAPGPVNATISRLLEIGVPAEQIRYEPPVRENTWQAPVADGRP